MAVRASLELSGLDHGPVSVHDKMVSMGLEAPSVASLARVLAGQGRGPRGLVVVLAGAQGGSRCQGRSESG